MTVYGYDAVSVLGNDSTLRVHTEGTNLVAVLLCSVYDLALIELVGKMREDLCGKLHAHADIYSA